MARYSEEEKTLIFDLLQDPEYQRRHDLLYAVLKPNKTTINRWMKHSPRKKSFIKKFFYSIRTDNDKLLWFIFEFFLMLAVFAVSFICFAVCFVLLFDLNPSIVQSGAFPFELFSMGNFIILIISLVLLLGGTVLSYISSRLKGSNKAFRISAFITLIAGSVLIIYFLFIYISLVVTSLHPYMMFVMIAFSVTVFFTFILYRESWKEPKQHEGYRSAMNLITILALVITMTTAAFSLVKGNDFSEKYKHIEYKILYSDEIDQH